MKSFILSTALVIGSAFGATAATVDLATSDLMIDGQTTSGNCPTAETPCILLSNSGPNSTATMTYNAGDLFTLSDFLYSAQGSRSEVTVTSNLGGSAAFGNPQGSATGLFADLSGAVGFADVISVTFTNTGNGTIRVGGFGATAPMPMDPPATVPLPAAGFLLLGALGAGVLTRRRS